MKTLKECYFNMIMIAGAIRHTWISNVAMHSFTNMAGDRELDPSVFPEKDIRKSYKAINLTVKAYLIIQTCSFMEEYKLFFKIKPEDPSQLEASIRFKKDIKTILKPGISYINDCWADLYKTRNEMLAHGWRGEGGDAIFFTDAVHGPFNAPLIDAEFTLLIGILGSMLDVLQEYNPALFSELDGIMQYRVNQKPSHLTRTTSHAFSTEEYRAVKTLMQRELQAIRNRE